MSLSKDLLSAPAPPSPTGVPPGSAGNDGVALEWSCNPWRERPGAASLAATAALGLCLVLTRWGGPFVLTLALCIAAVGALAPLLSPTRCRVDGEGVARLSLLGWQRRRWSEIRRAALLRGGVLLSPYARAHWLDQTRGLFLPLPYRTRRALLADLKARLARHGV